MAENNWNDNNSISNSNSTIVFPSLGSLFVNKTPTRLRYPKPLSKEGLLFKLLGEQGKIRSGGENIVW